jgi:hypothetical protein
MTNYLNYIMSQNRKQTLIEDISRKLYFKAGRKIDIQSIKS